ncbi:cold shock and DUF1294 domain-containing protein [Vibrio sp. CAU 1672]|uniref:cold shock and DUF1294 domain-containing protein n=1 Tax=Vibrio sp. CAU 1672 TaxID=3032594 RepID=UPI0023D9A9DC|nr:cold shock and DUF1294 domain-containing protein [Vibrio sp. CAU 1672]MDF2152550.1 cold shock and DUF1294 domain-containing protein [Vibrio sp. CAU 1672]
MKGRIVEWNDARGYGFIVALANKRKVFFHISSVKNSNVRPTVDDKVIFELSKDNKGRLSANSVTITSAKSVPLTVMFGCSYLVMVCASVILLQGEWFFIPVYLFMSLCSYLMYARDKRAAINGNWRTSESSLHMVSLLGGWPGALCAQNLLRHKSKKQPFKMILWLTVLINTAAFIWTFTAAGNEMIQTVLLNMPF